MSYVLESDFTNVNFMQNRQIATNTNAIGLHSDQLIELGQKQTKIGQDLTKFGNIELPALQATDQNIYDNINFNINRLNEMQDQINQAKLERDSIQSKIGNISGTNQSGGCAFWDIPCKMKETTSQIGLLAVLAGAGFIGYKVLTR